MPTAFDLGSPEFREEPELETAFGTKLVIVAGWCNSYADRCDPAERAEWLKFAAFLGILGGKPIDGD